MLHKTTITDEDATLLFSNFLDKTSERAEMQSGFHSAKHYTS
jgi:hypothetical protein